MGLAEILALITLTGQSSAAAITQVEKRRFRAISRSLRTIFFAPEGTLRLLDEILRGKEITDYHVQELSFRLHRTEAEVELALADLAMKFDAAGLDILIRDDRLCAEIRLQKKSIRREIKECVLWPLAGGANLDRERVKRLQADIKQMNAAIAELEANLRR